MGKKDVYEIWRAALIFIGLQKRCQQGVPGHSWRHTDVFPWSSHPCPRLLSPKVQLKFSIF